MTTIPPRRPTQYRRKSREQQRVSIDELVNEWKNEDRLKASYSSSPALSVLLESAAFGEEQLAVSQDSCVGARCMSTRSASSESMPSLEGDERSVLSLSSPRTPESLRSRKSLTNLRRGKPRPSFSREETVDDCHPLAPTPLLSDSDADDVVMATPRRRPSAPKTTSSFTSNLTTSLRALKNATLSSFASFSLSSATAASQRIPSSRFTDDMLWSHPYLFPRLTSEIRPAIQGTATEAQRRYHNPNPPLSFEEQETPFQLALHAPYLEEQAADLPAIQLQNYAAGGRVKRKSTNASKRAAGPDPNSEAGRALLSSATGMKQREPRENSDFLRVVVLEMNMRREGKLETGRARIWLPPRQVSGQAARAVGGTVPERWVGVSAYP
ncbi:hypothetical protein LTR62_000276 [Meristemomyces frigidus]|uniref:Uncharacterized protein n=1 Tax=Meristemomyces frigidus TaxID=1508187 RepID=A0AAN7YK66_9PEZI|nr:hypothetical protein LTR62_000276 [Meristemomyces frigidus]